ncbi:MAG: flagellar biosynthetic protein FliQ [Gammaproteobacteria bacterium]
MTINDALMVGRDALMTGVLLAGPLLLLILAVGVFIGLFQAATSIQEMTLSFVPKLVAVVIALFFLGNWLVVSYLDFFTRLISMIPGMIS